MKLYLENQTRLNVTFHIGDAIFDVPPHSGKVIEVEFPVLIWVASNAKGISGDILAHEVESEVAIQCAFKKTKRQDELQLRYGRMPYYI